MTNWFKRLLKYEQMNDNNMKLGSSVQMNYRLLGKSGLRVSELCLGTMTFGTDWGWGADKATAQQIFEEFVASGGNFFDSANRYTNGTSEQMLGEFVKYDRDRFIISTKYSLKDRIGDLNFAGNHRKNLRRSIEGSLKRLGTDYIDLLWLHSWDFTTDVEEVMHALDDLVRSGKVLHLGISNTPAWLISRANTIAEWRGLNKFAAIQVEYSLVQRTAERELFPMAYEMGLAMTSWGSLGNGLLSGKYLDGGTGRLQNNSPRFSESNTRIARELKSMASDLGLLSSQVALAWVAQREKAIIPILGVRSVEQLKSNLHIVQLRLPEDTIQRLNDLSAIDLGYPHELLASNGSKEDLYGGMFKKLIF